ncbi:MAG: zinc metallopeptidase [Deltaproteobacteria bacterium]|nr:zinc metallopeptidase [Deltaproteobacteria bacterium]MBN2672453.1 zinc metallopeptidase [Deltaproteobacteria bacterium]
MFGLFIDPLYFIVMIPGFLLAGWASMKVKSTFAKYSRIRSSRGLTGAETARQILRSRGIHDVHVEEARGFLSDHYDPRSRTVRLSPQVYREPSVASMAVAAHEVGHALQHADGYAPLALRSAAIPLAQLGSYAPWIIMIGGFLLHMLELVYVGVALFAVTVVFQLITLPVEFNASSRAKDQLAQMGLVSNSDARGVSKVLSAAAMTYVAAAVTAVMTLLYYLFRLGLLNSRDD